MKNFFIAIMLSSFFFGVAALAATPTPYNQRFLGGETGTFLGGLGATPTGAGADAANYSPRVYWMRVINTLLGLLGVFAASVIIYGGFQYMIAGGDPDKAKKAQKLLQYAVIGLAVIMAAWGLAYVALITIGTTLNL